MDQSILFSCFPGNGTKRLERCRHALGNNRAIKFVMRADPPGQLARGFLDALETPFSKYHLAQEKPATTNAASK
jgi:hypothetical protein